MDASVSPRIVFMGTPAFAVPSLDVCTRLGAVVAVYTAPDKPAGRGLGVSMSAVKKRALEHSIPVLQPKSLRKPEPVAELRELAPDVIVVAAYGKILPPEVLAIPAHGCVNVHASILPRHRGAAPIHAAILSGDAMAGVSIMLMDEGVDTGAILAIERIAMPQGATSGSLTTELAQLGAAALEEALPRWLAGQLTAVPQDDQQATYTRPISKEDGRLDWSRPAVELERAVRAFDPWPSATTLAGGDVLKILQARVADGSAEPGTLVLVGKEPAVGTAAGLLVLERVQPAGKRAQSGSEWLNGHRRLLGTSLGQPGTL